jgi:hypothetical protein
MGLLISEFIDSLLLPGVSVFRCCPVTMSAVDGARPLLGHDDDSPMQRGEEGFVDRKPNYRGRAGAIGLLLILGTSLISLVVYFALNRQWNGLAEFEPKLADHLGLSQGLDTERSLRWLLHPESHVSRDPGVRHLSWNITKATIAPNGVKKDVFLVNGVVDLCLAWSL